MESRFSLKRIQSYKQKRVFCKYCNESRLIPYNYKIVYKIKEIVTTNGLYIVLPELYENKQNVLNAIIKLEEKNNEK